MYLIGKFIEQHFHVVGSALPWKFIDAPWGGVPPSG